LSCYVWGWLPLNMNLEETESFFFNEPPTP
jgi:hypothetical protein